MSSLATTQRERATPKATAKPCRSGLTKNSRYGTIVPLPPVAIANLKVAGERGQSRPLVPNVPGQIASEALSATITINPADAATSARIEFDLKNSIGQSVIDLEPWMGEVGHLVLLSADGKHFVHSHIDRGKSRAGRLAFTVYFPAAGIYKGWGQFKRQGLVQNLPFVVRRE